jgi:hypothetical protein
MICDRDSICWSQFYFPLGNKSRIHELSVLPLWHILSRSMSWLKKGFRYARRVDETMQLLPYGSQMHEIHRYFLKWKRWNWDYAYRRSWCECSQLPAFNLPRGNSSWYSLLGSKYVLFQAYILMSPNAKSWILQLCSEMLTIHLLRIDRQSPNPI